MSAGKQMAESDKLTWNGELRLATGRFGRSRLHQAPETQERGWGIGGQERKSPQEAAGPSTALPQARPRAPEPSVGRRGQ